MYSKLLQSNIDDFESLKWRLKFLVSMWICASSITFLEHAWVNSARVTVIIWANLYKTPTCLVDVQSTVNTTVKTLKSIRNDESFDLFWEKALTHAKRLDENEPTLPRQRPQPKFKQNYFGYGNDKEAVHTCPKVLYHKYYFEAFDMVINCIEDDFDQEDFKMDAL